MMKEYDRILADIRKSGERLTIQRRLVIEALAFTHTHMSTAAVRDYIEANHPDQVIPEPTIYRILQWLKDLRMVSQTDMAEHGIVYEIIGASLHHHLICLNCGKTEDIDDDLFSNLRQQLHNKYHFRTRIDHMAIYGYCDECQIQS